MANRVVVVTGGGRGIGRAVCQRFAREGNQVVAASRTIRELEETVRLIQDAGGRCHPKLTDVCKPADITDLAAETVKLFHRIDVWVNCAGVAPKVPIEELEPGIFATIQAVNVQAVYHAARAAWPVMKQQHGGVIITISSVASADPFPGFAAYGASKAWVNLWTKALAEEGRPHGIAVFAVAPGAVETKMLRDAFPDFPEGAAMDPMDVACVVHGLSTRDCAYATGETIFVRNRS